MLFTPPVRCGLLPGVLRGNLIRRGKCTEAVLSVSDLKEADAIYCGNSVRGLVEVKL
jgi:branched-subunit amino acid aminotransferase/4-amino-4-deoxychorismate lyase